MKVSDVKRDCKTITDKRGWSWTLLLITRRKLKYFFHTCIWNSSVIFVYIKKETLDPDTLMLCVYYSREWKLSLTFLASLVLIIRQGYIWPRPHIVFLQNKHAFLDSVYGTEDLLETWGCFNNLSSLNWHPYLFSQIPGRVQTGSRGMYFV